MKSPTEFRAIYIYGPAVDMRKSYSGLSQIVKTEMSRELFSGELFVFSNRNRTLLKALYWRKTGFAIWRFRLEKNKFCWLKSGSEADVQISADQFRMLLDGCNLTAMKPHSPLEYTASY